ncbi:helix-turn-helix domain-containing protein [Desulfosporosinus sp. OT]|uniref:helix-turn-helix transcriptional regulator n=1 Tax=Desulfosporosinus sp. OT TaxID=913865 RepID=UPI000223A4F9|nr:helix-turn-helix domain-containing protein [Desulfosporosinus sp. OT]EGW36506.1 helix-turn-helix family protein [Desulfosporosinus sp. OT]
MAVASKAKKITFAKLKGLRAERGVSMAKMAKIIGISESAYIARETGRREFKMSEARVMSKYFSLPIEEIFFS